MADLKASSRAITNLLGTRSNILDGFIVVAKLTVLAGTGIIGAARIANSPGVVTYIAVGVVLVAGIFTLIAERSASTTLAEARTAMDIALEQEADAQNVLRKLEAAEKAYNAELDRLSHFQVARDLVRAILEGIATSSSIFEENAVIELILTQARRQLYLAFGFEMSDFYTICVYERVIDPDTGDTVLKCRANKRAIDCDIGKATVWKEGIGAAGSALASGQEVVVPDLSDPALGSLYKLPEKKTDDDVNYRSIVAEPIGMDGKEKLGGALVVTSSRPGHFSVRNRDYVNVAQSLAGMLALTVKLVRAKRGVTLVASHS